MYQETHFNSANGYIHLIRTKFTMDILLYSSISFSLLKVLSKFFSLSIKVIFHFDDCTIWGNQTVDNFPLKDTELCLAKKNERDVYEFYKDRTGCTRMPHEHICDRITNTVPTI